MRKRCRSDRRMKRSTRGEMPLEMTSKNWEIGLIFITPKRTCQITPGGRFGPQQYWSCEHEPSLYSPPTHDALLWHSAHFELCLRSSDWLFSGRIAVSKFSIQGLWLSRSGSALPLDLSIAFRFPNKLFLAFCYSFRLSLHAHWESRARVLLMRKGKAEK